MLKLPKNTKKERDHSQLVAITFFLLFFRKQPKPFLISFGFLAFQQLRQL